MSRYDRLEEVEKGIDTIEEVKKFNPYHGKDGRFSSKGGGGGIAGPMMAPDGKGGGGGTFSAAGAAKSINEISDNLNNGGGSRDNDWKKVRDILQSAPIGTVVTETGNRGAKFQHEKIGEDEWMDTSTGSTKTVIGDPITSKHISMSWASWSGTVPYVEIGTKDTAPTKQEVSDSQIRAVNGQLSQMLGGKR